MRRHRIKRSLPALLVVCVAVLGGALLLTFDSVSPGRIDAAAARRIDRLCGIRVTCEVRLGDLIPGAWDRFYEFSPSVPQPLIDRALATPEVHAAGLQRVLVLIRNGRVLRRQYGHTGQGQPLAGEVVFDQPPDAAHPGWVAYPPGERFQVSRCGTREGGSPLRPRGGAYFLLQPVGVQPSGASPCPLPGG